MPRDSVNFNEGKNWQEHCPYYRDEFPPNMPDPLGPLVRITSFIDADHAGEQLTRRLYSGIPIYINRALIRWYSKLKNTV